MWKKNLTLGKWGTEGLIYDLGSSREGRPQPRFLLHFYYFPFSKITLLV